MRKLPILLAVVLLAGCKPPEESNQKAIIGGMLIDGAGGPPHSDSVVIVAGSRIRLTGSRANVPIPAGLEKIDGSGKFIVPGIVDLHAHPELFRIVNEKIRTPESVVEEARARNLPVFLDIYSLGAAKRLVDAGANGFLHMIRDTDEIDPAFIARLRALRIVFAPALVSMEGGDLERAKRNTKRLAAGGVLIALDSDGGSAQREMLLLSEAGLSPMEVILAATRNGAEALRKSAEFGTLEPGRSADLLMLSANPLEDVRNFGKIDRSMVDGEWTER